MVKQTLKRRRPVWSAAARPLLVPLSEAKRFLGHIEGDHEGIPRNIFSKSMRQKILR